MDYIDPNFCGRWTGRTLSCGTCTECELSGKLDITYNNLTNTYFSTDFCPYTQLPFDIPYLKYFYTQWELNFSSVPYVCWAAEHMNLAYVICVFYLIIIFGIQYVMKNRKAFSCKPLLSVWNLVLSFFSLIGFLRTAPHLLYYMYARDHGFYYSVCMPAESNFGQGATGFWVLLFVFSKIPELIDTLFIVLRKQKLIFLHWYHHITVLLFCWHSYSTRSSAGLYFATMNYGVHTLMYYYYFLTSLGYKKLWWAPIVTALQISQMFIGICICAVIYYYQSSYSPYVDGCDVSIENFTACFLMYLSYFVLFVWFAVEKYIFPDAAKHDRSTNLKKDGSVTSPDDRNNNDHHVSSESSFTHTSTGITSTGNTVLRKRNV